MYGRILLRPQHLCPPWRPLNAARNMQGSFQSRRCVHRLRELPYDIEKGLGDFLSPAALHMIAVEYQQGLLTRLNEQVKGTEMANQSVTQTVISAAGHRRHALAFNYASQALNNSFFLNHLKPPEPPQTDNEHLMGSLHEEIRLNFGSLSQLKSTFSAAALGMINSGWVWLVSDERASLQVVATFGAGTLLVRSRRHALEDSEAPILGEAYAAVYGSRARGPVAPPHPASSPSSGVQSPVPGLDPPGSSRALHAASLARQQYDATRAPDVYNMPSMLNPPRPPQTDAAEFDKVGDILTPILCVSVQEHAWVGAGYGVWGKEEYLKRFWTVVNWEEVSRAFEKAIKYR